MTGRPPPAAIRTEVIVPLRFPDGFDTVARVLTFDGLVDGREHLALALGDRVTSPDQPDGTLPTPLVRLHSECLTGDVFGSQRCDCGPQMREAVERITEVGGYLLYLRQEGRGIGLYGKLDAYALQDVGLDTYEANVALGFRADARDYTAAAQMIHALGIPGVALLVEQPGQGRAAGPARRPRQASGCRPASTGPPPTPATSPPRRCAAPTPSTLHRCPTSGPRMPAGRSRRATTTCGSRHERNPRRRAMTGTLADAVAVGTAPGPSGRSRRRIGVGGAVVLGALAIGALLGVLARTVGLGGAGWVVGIGSGGAVPRHDRPWAGRQRCPRGRSG